MKDDSTWSIATGEDGGHTLIFRIRNSPPEFANQVKFPHLLAISWPLNAGENNGMPSLRETDRMAELEDLLEDGIESPGAAFLTASLTGNNVREWQWYALAPGLIMELINKTLGHLDSFPIQISFRDDPDWEGWHGPLGITRPPAQ